MNRVPRIIPVILSGGSGTRLWPMSTPDRPKQLLALTSDKSLLQQTLQRTRDRNLFDLPILVANARHVDEIEKQILAIGDCEAKLILEPCARNTAPAIALAALEAGSSVLLVMPSDHVIADEAAFLAAIEAARPFVDDGCLVTFGVSPSHAECGYGYIQKGEELGGGVSRVSRFIEKPDRKTAELLSADGQHLWNAGIFLFRADCFLEALAAHSPEILSAARHALSGAVREAKRVYPDANRFSASPSDSIDYAVMEKAENIAVVPVNMGWSDVGSWDALYELKKKDKNGNIVAGDVRLEGASGMMVESNGLRISASGVRDLIIIANGKEVLILPRGKSQDAKKFGAT